MTPRQARLAVDAYAALVVMSVGIALAALTWRLTGETGVAPAAAPVAARGDSGDIRPLLALAPFGAAVAAPVGGDIAGMRLRAIFMAVPASASVTLIAGSDGKVGTYPVGGALSGGVIEAIEPERVLVRTGAGLSLLGLNAPSTAGSTAAAAKGAASGAASFVPVGSAPPLAPLSASPPLAAGVRPALAPLPSAPTLPTGLAIGAPPPALAAAGLRAGDIVMAVNGAPVSTGTDPAGLIARAVAAGSAQIDVLRDGRRMSFTLATR